MPAPRDLPVPPIEESGPGFGGCASDLTLKTRRALLLSASAIDCQPERGPDSDLRLTCAWHEHHKFKVEQC